MSETTSYQRSVFRRSIGVGIALAPAVLALASIFSALPPYSFLVGVSLASISLAIAVFNSWLSFIRPSLWEYRHGTMDGYRHVSGVPGLGTIFATLACVIGFGSDLAASLVIASLLIDTGGLPWFVLVATWGDSSFWDNKVESSDKKHSHKTTSDTSFPTEPLGSKIEN